MILCTASQKGGTGKTTSTMNVTALLAKEGYRTLLVDLDPQGACAISIGIDPDELEHTVYDVLVNELPVADAIHNTPFGFDLLPANIDLAEAELALAGRPLREYALRRALQTVRDRYDYIVIDTPPTLGLLTINAFATADQVLVPVSTQLLSLRGLATLFDTITRMKRYEVNSDLEVLGILPTKYDGRTIHAREILAYLAEFGATHNTLTFPPVRQTVRFDEAPNEQTPFVLLYPDDEATRAYREVVDSVIQTQSD